MKLLIIILTGCIQVVIFSGSCNAQKATAVKLVGRWKLQGDAKDYSGNGNDGITHNVGLSQQSGALFNGIDGYIEVQGSTLKAGTGDFTLSAWVKCEPGTYVPGDIINKYDADKRKGINFQVLSGASAYNSVSDYRRVFFGTDNARDGDWVDCGRPVATNMLISAFIVYKNHLYAGISETTDPGKACRLYRYDGGQKWTPMQRVSKDMNTPSIMSVIIHKGDLYVGTGKWDYMDQETAGHAGVYKLMSDGSWQELGKFPAGKKRIHSITSFNGSLYEHDNMGETYRYDEASGTWVLEHKVPRYKTICSMVYHDELFGGVSNHIEKLDQKGNWSTAGHFDFNVINQVHTMDVYQGKLYGGTWPEGLIIRYDGDNNWAHCGWVGVAEKTIVANVDSNGRPLQQYLNKNEIQELEVYNGKMYAGVIPKGEVWRYDGGEKTTLIRRLVHNPQYTVDDHETWCRVPAMGVYQGKLFAGTGSVRGYPADTPAIEGGKVYSWETGKCITYDNDIGTGWRLVTAVREKAQLKLYIDGRLVSSSPVKDTATPDVDNDKPLLIGFGSQNYFRGMMKDVRVYSGALTKAAVAALYRDTK